MGMLKNRSDDIRERIVQEMVPGKQITLAHIVANPDSDLYVKLGLNPTVDYSRSAIGIMTACPSETTIIMADIAVKAAGVQLGFVDRFTGTLIITGTVSEVEAAMKAILEYTGEKLGFTHFPITRT
ncbi:MAG: BMC domain-containing protein [Lachnospiraceae bacterium]|nr:BMC domain-containing protein [Lachnospiraceae bacterium]MDY5742887.1 BMC domain-containing protein [Lachnospiraceae bacterium]